MTFKKTAPKKDNFFPDAISACEFIQGKFFVPPEWEDYYVRVWAWKKARKITVEAYKLKYLAEYEAKYGPLTHWQDHKGNLRPLYLLG